MEDHHQRRASVRPRLNEWWRRYQQYVQTHQASLYFYDDTISRLLFLLFGGRSIDASGSNNHTPLLLHDILYGCLELHRILLQVAIATISPSCFDHPPNLSHDALPNENEPIISTTHLRFGLDMLQSLYPLSQEIVRILCTVRSSFFNRNSSNNNSHESHILSASISYRQALVRRYIEWTRLVLRLTLFIRYWKRFRLLWKRHYSPRPVPGLMQPGGRWSCNSDDEQEHQRRRMIERNQYVGKRTGRCIVATTTNPIDHHRTAHATSNQSSESTTSWHFARIVVGELLYMCRPVVQVESEVRSFRSRDNRASSRLWNGWVTSLCMDIMSIICLNTLQPNVEHIYIRQPQSHIQQQYNNCTNPATVYELQRRKMRLWMYLLRSPIWEIYTERMVQRCSDILYRLPLLGGFLREYMNDYIYYWKFYRVEEG